MRLCTPAQMKEIERRTEGEFLISGETLMEAAGCLAAKELQQAYLPELTRGRLAIICGGGNNGADGLVMARHLSAQGILALEVFLVGPVAARTPLFQLQLSRALKQGVRVNDLEKGSNGFTGLKDFTVIVDALVGTGVNRDLTGDAAAIVDLVNATSCQVVSVDVPSGLCAQTGKVFGQAIRAQMTITFGLAKPGLIVGAGPEHAGRIRVVQIGLPRALFRAIAKTHFTFHEKLARRWLPVRRNDSNKSTHGHLLIVAGRPGMWGAGALCSEAAYRTGSGYVTLATPTRESSLENLVQSVGPEILVGHRDARDILEKKTAVVVGPGAGADEGLEKFITRLLIEKMAHVVLDADALTVLSKMKAASLPAGWVLTPHSGELARLLGVTSAEIDKDRFHHATAAAKKFGCLVLLKGYRSVLADPRGRLAIITSGNAALAKAGTGDVLAGMIGALLAQGVKAIPAVGTAAYLHGRLADDWLRLGKDVRSFMPRDLIAALPDLLGQIARA